MTAVNIINTGRAVHIVTDGASYFKTGMMAGQMNKVFTMPHMRAAIATRGPAGLAHRIGPLVCDVCFTFDELVSGTGIIGALAQCRDYLGDDRVNVIVAGWSESRGVPEVYCLDTDKHIWSERPTLKKFEENTLTAPGVSEKDYHKAKFVMVSDENDSQFCKSMVTLMEIQRQDCSPGELSFVGGFVQLTTIDRDWIAQRVIHRWPDKIGSKIEPAAIDWTAYQAAGMSRKERRALEASQRRQYNAAVKDIAGADNFIQRVNGGGAFNPFDANEKRYADAAFVRMGGDLPALQSIANKAGMIPKSAATMIRGDMQANDPGRVANALTVANNLMVNNPNIFHAVEGQKEFEEGVVTFRHYVETLGMTAQAAAQRIVKERDPQYQANLRARIKAEDIDAKIKKELTINDLRKQFDDSWIPWDDPNVAFDPRVRSTMFGIFAEEVKERYLDTGDWDKAKALAANTLKKTWGVTRVNGTATVVPYPIERAPVFGGANPIERISERVALDAVQTIKDETGQVVDRSSIRLMPLPGGVTSMDYWDGKAPRYQLAWQDKDGVVQMLRPGRAYVPDVGRMRAEQDEERRTGFSRLRDASDMIYEATRPERFEGEGTSDVAQRGRSEGVNARLKRAGALLEPSLRTGDEKADARVAQLMDDIVNLPANAGGKAKEMVIELAKLRVAAADRVKSIAPALERMGAEHEALRDRRRQAYTRRPAQPTSEARLPEAE